MDSKDVEAYFVKLAAYNEQQNERMEKAIQRMDAIAANLDTRAQQFNAGGERFGQQALGVIGAQGQQVIADNLGQAAGQLSGQLRQGAQAAQQAAEGLSTQRSLLTRAQTTLVWKGLAALIIGATLAIVGFGYFARKSMQQIEQAHFGQDILNATQNGAITRCGEALCVKVGKRPQRYGSDYILLEP